MNTATAITMDEAALYNLMSWLSPAYPVGAFSHSSGLEWAVEAGWITGLSSLQGWLEDVLDIGAGWNDAVLFTYAHRAASRSDAAALREAAELAAAQNSRERRLEVLAQGDAFWRIASDTAASDTLSLLEGLEGELAYPVVVATLVAGHGIPAAAGLTAYLHALTGNIVSAAQRLIPLGQTDGQRAMTALRQAVAACVARAMALPEGDPFDAMGGCTLLADLATMLHETQYTRLFRT